VFLNSPHRETPKNVIKKNREKVGFGFLVDFFVKTSSKTMQGGGAEVKQKMQDGRAKKCKAVKQKLNKKMQDGRAKKCKMD
jgi:hypothetical protein